MWKEFKEFINQGNVMDMAIGIIIGGAFGKIVSSLVEDILMPVIGLITGGNGMESLFYALDGNTYPSIEAAQAAGVGTINYGMFITAIIDFLIISFVIFLMIKQINKLKKPAVEEVTTKNCPYCLTEIPLEATRCPHCTSSLEDGHTHA